MEFPLHTEGGRRYPHHFLMKLRDSQLKDVILEEFYDKVIAIMTTVKYYIILIHCAYDIPAKATDGTGMFDASEYVYKSSSSAPSVQ